VGGVSVEGDLRGVFSLGRGSDGLPLDVAEKEEVVLRAAVLQPPKSAG
jgi:hypothetical protein